jgi:seryl-tRNA synthetase
MLTLKLITEETERVIRGLEKKQFKGAKEAIDEVLNVDKCRREAQQELDKNLSEAKGEEHVDIDGRVFDDTQPEEIKKEEIQNGK